MTSLFQLQKGKDFGRGGKKEDDIFPIGSRGLRDDKKGPAKKKRRLLYEQKAWAFLMFFLHLCVVSN